MDTSPFQLGAMAMRLLGGLALFLFGLEQLTDALKMLAGGGMKRLLARLTNHRLNAAFTGAAVTAVIQSSSVTTVLVVGFVTAGLMTLRQSIGVIMGANIGTTVTAQVIAFKITRYGLLLLAVGFALTFLGRRERIRRYGSVLLGLGLIFFGMELMGEGTRPLRDYPPFLDLMQQLQNPLSGILVGAAFTAVVQSSSATTGIIIVLAGQGLVTLEAGITLALGANIGTSVTAVLAALGKPREAVQAATVHVLFNVLGVLLWFGFIDQLAQAARSISPGSPALAGGAELAAAATPRQIANAHTVFNVTNTLLLIWLIGPIAWLLQRLIPERSVDRARKPQYLDPILFDTPDLALDRVRLELGRLGERALEMVRQALTTVIDGSFEDLARLRRLDDELDHLHGAIVTYLGELSQENLLREQTQLLSRYLAIANYLENIGDTIETSLVGTGLERLNQGVDVSYRTRKVFRGLHASVLRTLEQAVTALVQEDAGLAELTIAAKAEINLLADEADRHLARRLTASASDRLTLFRLETDLIEYLKRVYYFARRIAKALAERRTGTGEGPAAETEADAEPEAVA